MVDLTRRETVIGLGLLATGGGATFTQAAFQSSTQPDSDLRVVVDQNLQFGANPGLNTTRDDIADDSGFFDDADGADSGTLNESGGVFDDENEGSGSDDDGDEGFDPDGGDRNGDGFNEGFEPRLPKAFAEGVNDELTIKAAVQIGTTHTFDNLLRVGNGTESTVQIGIAYDREGQGNGENGNYGADVVGSEDSSRTNEKLNRNQAQKIYQFQTKDNTKLISPAPGDTGESGSLSGADGISIDSAGDRPNTLIELGPGESADLDLVVNTSDSVGESGGNKNDVDVEGDILDAADIDQGAFGFQTDTVQIMDVLTVVSQPKP